jgi:hypothetical protein
MPLMSQRARTILIVLALALFLPIADSCDLAIRSIVGVEEGAEHSLYRLRHSASTKPSIHHD